jgi:hypothetical protein
MAAFARCARCKRPLLRAKYVALGVGYFCLKKIQRDIPPNNSGPGMHGEIGRRGDGVADDDPIRSLGDWEGFPTDFKFQTWWAGVPLVGLPKFPGKIWLHVLLGNGPKRGGHLWSSVINDRRVGKTAFPASWGPVEIASALSQLIHHYFSVEGNQALIDMAPVVLGHDYILTVNAHGKPESVKLLVNFRVRNNQLQIAALYPLAGDGVFRLDGEILNRGKSVMDAVINLPLPKRESK